MASDTDIAHCPDCGSDAAAIADGRAYPDDRWVMLIRCGECGVWRELDLSGAAMRDLEARIMDGWDAIERELLTLTERVEP